MLQILFYNSVYYCCFQASFELLKALLDYSISFMESLLESNFSCMQDYWVLHL